MAGMTGVYAKAVAGATVLPALRKVPGVGSLVGAARELPERELTRTRVEVDRDHLAAYDRVCGFTLRDVLPPTYPHIAAFPLAMELMTDTSFPFPVMGLVHVANRIEVLAPISADDPFSLRVWAADMAEHERGTQFDVHAEATVAGTPAWRSSSTYLHRSGGGDGRKPAEKDAPRDVSAVWEVPGDTGRRYAAVSGDRNPIHLHPLSARLFGLRGHIAHGMWTKARCLAALEGELPEAYGVEVRFKLPVFLPARVAFSTWLEGGARRFGVRGLRDGRPHLDGRLS
jgi:acyl dehydratase